MILRQFPDLQWLKTQASTQFANRHGAGGVTLENKGWPSVVLRVKTKEVVRDNIRGPLSIFTNLSGKSEIRVDKKRVTVTPENFFISNAGQQYTLEVCEKTPTETFNIHFGEHFTEGALRSCLSTPEQLLENQFDNTRGNFGFHNRVVPRSDEFIAILLAMRLQGDDKLFLEENLFRLLAVLLQEQKKVEGMQDRLTALKASTKQEIFKRLMIATDYLYTFYHKNPDLDELARISCLSKFHFLRLFKTAYQQTPHQFVTSLKIKRAKELLLHTNLEVSAVARELGFDAPSMFSRQFYRLMGAYPTQFRANS